MKHMKFSVETLSCTNKRDIQKPNEDVIIADTERGIFILLDGVTRPHNEYRECPGSSAARDASEIFAREVYAYLKDHSHDGDKECLLREAAAYANRQLLPLRNEKSLAQWEFYPATLGIVALIDDGVLHYLTAGDCIGVLLRGSSRILFGKELSLEGVDLFNPSKAERYEKYCNRHPDFLAYTVFNGDESAPATAEYSFLHLGKGDTVLFVTDGLGYMVKFEKQDTLKLADLEDLLVLSDKYDSKPFGKYADDKSIVRICVE